MGRPKKVPAPLPSPLKPRPTLARIEAEQAEKARQEELSRAEVEKAKKEEARTKRAARAVAKTPVASPEPSAPPPRTTNQVLQAAVDEAFALPYEPPSYHFGQNDDPYAELAQRELCRRKILPFIQRFRPKYNAGWVHEDICRRVERFVEQVEQGLSPRLLLLCPPRTGKSEIGSRHVAPWALGKHPDWEIIATSNSASLSLSFSRYIRDLMRDPGYQTVFADAKLDPSSQSVENWNLTRGGGYMAAGVGTGIVGRGATILLVDDVVRDMEAADSPTIRENIWEWYLSVAYTRLAPGGGVLGILCMTGDTPVLMADGTQRRLDTLKPSDDVATYARGTLASTKVVDVRSNGSDSVFKITTSSDRILRANQRHPFLTVLPSGEVTWTRLKHLTTAHRIVTVKGSGANGEGLSALPRGVASLPSVEGFARITMANSVGRLGAAATPPSSKLEGTLASSTGTVSPEQSTTRCTTSKKGAVPSVGNTPLTPARHHTGSTNSQSITATTPGGCEPCSATTATQESDILLMSQWHLPPLGISDFTLERVISVEHDGEEEVFDLQVEETENFIANGAVSHNTWWNEDDWAGRIIQAMEHGEGDKFEVVKYPAINDQGDEYILADDSIEQLPPDQPPPPGSRLTRRMGTAIHPERYTTEMMLKIKRNLIAGGQKRVWDALYQQNPTPDDGNYFSKDMFRYYGSPPARRELRVYQAWDFAISEGKDSDYTVGVCLGVDHRDNVYLLDVMRFRSGDGGYIIDTILDFAAQYDADALGFEDGQIWKAIEFQFKKRCEERRQYPSFELLKPLTDKMVRANPLRGRMQLGKVYFDKNAPWFDPVYREMIVFPAGKHDDCVDAIAWAVRLTLSRAAPREERKQARLKSWKDELSGLLSGKGSSHMAA